VVEQGNLEIVRLMLASGADANALGYKHRTSGSAYPLEAAVQSRDVEMLKLLLSHGADVDLEFTAYHYGYIAALHVAVLNEDLEILKVLIGSGADLDKLSRSSGGPRGERRCSWLWSGVRWRS
jgi:ankyrin repeat protein